MYAALTRPFVRVKNPYPELRTKVHSSDIKYLQVHFTLSNSRVQKLFETIVDNSVTQVYSYVTFSMENAYN